MNLKYSKSKEKLFNLSKNLYINDFNLNQSAAKLQKKSLFDNNNINA